MRGLIKTFAATSVLTAGLVLGFAAPAAADASVDIKVGPITVMQDIPVPVAAVTCGVSTEALNADLAVDGTADCGALGFHSHIEWHVEM